MGFTTGDLPPVEAEEFLRKPLMERTRILTLHWVDYGFGSPKMLHTIYLVKILVLYIGAGVALATITSDAGSPLAVGDWWDEPIVWQKLVVWTVLLEAFGVAGSWGPLAGKFKPMTGSFRFWARPGTIRLPPWKAVPLTAGNRRTWVDAALYVGFLVSLLAAVVAPGRSTDELDRLVGSTAFGGDGAGLIRPSLLVAPIVLWVVLGLRDKIVFLAARGEQYLPALVMFAVLGFVDMILAAKLLIVVVWVGAGVSKIGHHFTQVVPPMMSNSPLLVSKALRRRFYRNVPDDLRPSGLAWFMGHIAGTAVEIALPIVLLFSTNRTVTVLAVVSMVLFHAFIFTAFPLAVPLEWNVLFAYLTVFLFLGYPAQDGFSMADWSSPLLAVAILGALVFFPILGNLRPDLVSFLPSMRQYAGNWASALWCMAPGVEERFNTMAARPCKNQYDQLIAMGYEPEVAEITLQQTISWRTMHSQARGLFSLLVANVPDVDTRTVREAEFACNSIIGFNFGDGHLHGEDLIAALQEELQFAPGELLVVWVESQAIHSRVQHYKVIDAALGVVERGTWNVDDAVAEQPWLPNGPIPLDVTWRRDGGWPVTTVDLTDTVGADIDTVGAETGVPDDDAGERLPG